MDLTRQWKTYKIASSHVELRRLETGVVEIRAENFFDIQRGLGFVHATDRLMQMLLTRIVGRGGLTKYFLDSEEGFAIDLLVRKMGFFRYGAQDLAHITPEALQWTEAYCEGVNEYLEKNGMPLLCKFFNVNKEKWRVTDTLLIIKTLSYLGIAQQQEKIERLIIHAIRDGVSPDKLKKIFGIDEIDEQLIEWIKKLELILPYFDSKMRFQPFASMMSNNWVVAPHKTSTNSAFFCFDPHLQVNRLPSTWYEVVATWDGNYRAGITIPGFPGWIMGRSNNLSASFTYGMLDTIDFFIEEIRRGQYRRGERWFPLTVHEERVHRKSQRDMILYFFETDIGVIEKNNPESPAIADGYYLSLAWANFRQGTAAVLNSLMHLWTCQSVDEAQMYLWSMTLPCNWVIADSKGNIALQQSGCIPKRKSTGLLPLPAWEEENLWQGYYMGTELASEFNPKRGFALSANDTKEIAGSSPLSTVRLADYRYRRLYQVLSEEKRFTIEDMKALQNDCYSLQAEDFMHQIRDWIPNTTPGQILKDWDMCYRKDSMGPVLFEAVYEGLLKEIFGPIFGKTVWATYGPGNTFFGCAYGHFDQILLSDDPFWFGSTGKASLFQKVISDTLSSFEQRPIPTWGENHAFFMNYLLFDGRAPKFLGFDIGPIQLNGNRATVDTFQVYREANRLIITSATYRMVTDMGTNTLYSVLAGGASEKKRSKYYTSDVEIWKTGCYKKIHFDESMREFSVFKDESHE